MKRDGREGEEKKGKKTKNMPGGVTEEIRVSLKEIIIAIKKTLFSLERISLKSKPMIGSEE